MWHDIDQNTEEWLQLRSGKVTGSAIAKIMANYGKAFGEPAKKLAVDIAIEQITGKRIETNDYSNAHMERGHEQEPIARMLYERENFCEVSHGGFYDNGDTGCSPDGLVMEDGLIEIKCVIVYPQYKTLKRGTCDSAYKWQVNFNLKESGREWIDYVSYCSNFTDNRKLITHRIYAEDQLSEFLKIDIRLHEFWKLIEEVKNDIQL